MARNSKQLMVAIETEEGIIAEAESAQTRAYARERLSYLRGELVLQKAKEARGASQTIVGHCGTCGKEYPFHRSWCDVCGERTVLRQGN